MSLKIDIEKKLGKFNLQVKLEAGDEVLALLGASGSGKSMTLKCIAGIEKPDKGFIEVNGRVLFDSEKRINLSPQNRLTGLMFQNYGLFPNMTVRQNIMAGARRISKRANSKIDSSRIREGKGIWTGNEADEIIERFGLKPVEQQLPGQLSGGQQQRTALARILVSRPDILMLDEPFSALDAHLRFRMEQEVREVIKNFGGTVVLVSHDRDEVFRLSDKIAVINEGKIEISGQKNEVFRNPETLNCAMLTGCKNISPIKKLDERHLLALDWGIVLESGQDIKDAGYVGIRMHHVNGESEVNSFNCKVAQEIENPFTYTLMLKTEDNLQAEAFGWELGKAEWNKIRSEDVRIHIPYTSILLLR